MAIAGRKGMSAASASLHLHTRLQARDDSEQRNTSAHERNRHASLDS